jgi:glycosyltransferase involved in cell wall biosynthesis
MYPSEGPSVYYTTNLGKIAKKVDPDVILLNEDAQHVIYPGIEGRAPVIAWFPWDLESWSSVLDSVIQHVDVPVCTSDFVQEMFREHGHDIDKIYYCADDRVYYPERNEVVDRYKHALGIRPGVKVVLYVGMFHPRKNPESLLAMAAHLKKIRGSDFLIIMHGDLFRWVSCDIAVEIITRDIEDVVLVTPGVDWHKGVSQERMRMLYNVADVFASAHGGEGFGLPAVEAGLCGKPFVMTDCTTTKEFSQDGRSGVAIPSFAERLHGGIKRPIPDHVKMAEEVSALLDDDKRRERMGRHWMETVMTKYTTKQVIPAWEKVLDRCYMKSVKVRE